MDMLKGMGKAPQLLHGYAEGDGGKPHSYFMDMLKGMGKAPQLLHGYAEGDGKSPTVTTWIC